MDKLYGAITDVKVRDVKVGDTLCGVHINYFNAHVYNDVCKINETAMGLNVCVPYLNDDRSAFVGHYFPVYRAGSKDAIKQSLHEKILKEAKEKRVNNIYEINRFLQEFYMYGLNPMLYKYGNSLLLIDVNAFKVFIEFSGLAYSYAIAYHKPLVYMFEDAKRILSSLEKEIEDIQTMGYKE